MVAATILNFGLCGGLCSPDILVPGQGLYWTELHTENWSPMRDLNSRYAKVAKFAEHSVGNLRFKLRVSCSQNRRINQTFPIPDTVLYL